MCLLHLSLSAFDPLVILCMCYLRILTLYTHTVLWLQSDWLPVSLPDDPGGCLVGTCCLSGAPCVYVITPCVCQPWDLCNECSSWHFSGCCVCLFPLLVRLVQVVAVVLILIHMWKLQSETNTRVYPMAGGTEQPTWIVSALLHQLVVHSMIHSLASLAVVSYYRSSHECDHVVMNNSTFSLVALDGQLSLADLTLTALITHPLSTLCANGPVHHYLSQLSSSLLCVPLMCISRHACHLVLMITHWIGKFPCLSAIPIYFVFIACLELVAVPGIM